MRSTLRDIGRLRTGAGGVTLRVSQGVHSGTFHLFLVGDSHREHMLVGSRRLDRRADGEGRRRRRGPHQPADRGAAARRRASARRRGPGCCSRGARGPALRRAARSCARPLEAVAQCLPTMVRAHVLSGDHPSEHRNVTVAFLQFTETDELIAREGLDATADALEELVVDVQRAADHYEVAFLESDVDDGGGKLLLTAGAPRIIGDDEERMLLAMRRVLEGGRRLPVRIGVNRGNVFAGEIGPPYRSTYSVMGDAVNLAARVMSKAPPGELYCTAGRARPLADALPHAAPRAVRREGQGRARAGLVGRAAGLRPHARQALAVEFPLVGRTAELADAARALDAARAGHRRGSSRSSARPASARPGWPRSCASARRTWSGCRRPPRRSRSRRRTPRGASCCATRSASAGRTPTTSCSRGSSRPVRERAPELLPWLPLLASRSTSMRRAPPRSTRSRPRSAASRLHETVIAFLRALLDGPTLIACDDAQYLDEASADLFAAIAREIATTPWLVVLVRRDAAARFTAPERRSTPCGSSPVRCAPTDTRHARRGGDRRGAAQPGAARARRASAAAATRSSCATCCAPPPRATATSCRRASRPPRWRASIGSTRSTARSSGAPRCWGSASTRASSSRCSATTCRRRRSRRGSASSRSSRTTATATCASAA